MSPGLLLVTKSTIHPKGTPFPNISSQLSLTRLHSTPIEFRHEHRLLQSEEQSMVEWGGCDIAFIICKQNTHLFLKSFLRITESTIPSSTPFPKLSSPSSSLFCIPHQLNFDMNTDSCSQEELSLWNGEV
ncbi:hypothetical protein CEXT_247081 [Caerostris extrusa]|uniref:Uncharacterized protein n=1 Tax=Caerostris extrusa TaxID=172846 RepID=A0AAV4XI47_CAEEX|nr:hypothetical protein CEXT_247081 [Caerostris extrusa]